MNEARYPVLPPEVPQLRGQRVLRWLGHLIYWLSGWRIRGEFPPVAKAVAIAAPHSSNWDGIIGISCAYALGLRAAWMGKDSLFKFGLGGIMRAFGGIATDRSNRSGAVGQMSRLFAEASNMWLVLAPEGTRKPVRKWRTGFWHIAQEAGVPLVPIAIDFEARCFVIGPPYQPTGDKARDLAALYEFYRPFRGKGGKSALPLERLEAEAQGSP